MDHQPAAEAPAIVRLLAREDVLWNRPVFKAPPLNVVPPIADISQLVQAIRKPDVLGG
jgi:hypothetical protein